MGPASPSVTSRQTERRACPTARRRRTRHDHRRTSRLAALAADCALVVLADPRGRCASASCIAAALGCWLASSTRWLMRCGRTAPTRCARRSGRPFVAGATKSAMTSPLPWRRVVPVARSRARERRPALDIKAGVIAQLAATQACTSSAKLGAARSRTTTRSPTAETTEPAARRPRLAGAMRSAA